MLYTLKNNKKNSVHQLFTYSSSSVVLENTHTRYIIDVKSQIKTETHTNL